MARIPLVTDRDGLDAEGRAAFDRITESRGELPRPFEVLLHAPAMARRAAELGQIVRFESHLPDRDRELVTLATGRAHGCRFVWESHLDAARAAGVEPDTLAALERGDDLGGRDGILVSFASELCRTGEVSDRTFEAARELLGTPGTVELALTVGYYTMLGYAMSACDAC